jgi:hypothetical protein
MTTLTNARIEQMTWVNLVLDAARAAGLTVRANRNGDRQIDFENKSLAEDHLRRLFQDIDRKKCVYTRLDMDELLRGSRPCASAPFFEMAVEAGLATISEKDGKRFYRFDLSNPLKT